jgi:hypothetical protein
MVSQSDSPMARSFVVLPTLCSHLSILLPLRALKYVFSFSLPVASPSFCTKLFILSAPWTSNSLHNFLEAPRDRCNALSYTCEGIMICHSLTASPQHAQVSCGAETLHWPGNRTVPDIRVLRSSVELGYWFLLLCTTSTLNVPLATLLLIADPTKDVTNQTRPNILSFCIVFTPSSSHDLFPVGNK